MTSFEYYQRLAALAGKFMCDLCFNSYPEADAWVDRTGQAWTLCQACGEGEEVHRG